MCCSSTLMLPGLFPKGLCVETGQGGFKRFFLHHSTGAQASQGQSQGRTQGSRPSADRSPPQSLPHTACRLP